MVSANNDQPEFLYLDTRGWKTGKKHRIEIWFVEHDNKYYVMSETRERSHWVQNIMHDPKVSFSISGRKFDGTARVIRQENEPEYAEIITRLMNAKYRWDKGLIVEISSMSTSTDMQAGLAHNA
jgi:deazaflavin-dependent oxidoreductase (nitroreductase family)